MTYQASARLAILMLAAILLLTLAGTLVIGEWSIEIGTLLFIAAVVVVGFDHERRHFSAMRKVEEGIAALTAERDDTLRQMEGIVYLYSRLQPDLPLPPFNKATVRPDFAERLAGEVISRQAPVVIELGSGVSTAIVGLCMKKIGAGRAISFDHEPKYGELTRQMLAMHRVADFATVTDAPLRDYVINGESWRWYDIDMSSIPAQIDILIVDGPPAHDTAPGPLSCAAAAVRPAEARCDDLP